MRGVRHRTAHKWIVIDRARALDILHYLYTRRAYMCRALTCASRARSAQLNECDHEWICVFPQTPRNSNRKKTHTNQQREVTLLLQRSARAMRVCAIICEVIYGGVCRTRVVGPYTASTECNDIHQIKGIWYTQRKGYHQFPKWISLNVLQPALMYIYLLYLQCFSGIENLHIKMHFTIPILSCAHSAFATNFSKTNEYMFCCVGFQCTFFGWRALVYSIWYIYNSWSGFLCARHASSVMFWPCYTSFDMFYYKNVFIVRCEARVMCVLARRAIHICECVVVDRERHALRFINARIWFRVCGSIVNCITHKTRARYFHSLRMTFSAAVNYYY